MPSGYVKVCLCARVYACMAPIKSVQMTMKAWTWNFVSIFVDLEDWVSATLDSTVRNSHSMTRLSTKITQITHKNKCSTQVHLPPVWLNILSFTPIRNIHTMWQIYFPCVSALLYMCVSVYTLAHSRTLPPSRSVTNYLIKFHCIKATFMNLV